MDISARLKIANNPQTSPQVLAQLALDKSRFVREAVAANLQTPSDVLIRLALDQAWEVRRVVACNPKTPRDVLVQLAQDEKSWVRAAVAGNSQTPVDTLNLLAECQSFHEQIAKSLLKRSVEQLCELAVKASPTLAQIMISFHQRKPLPLEVLQAGLKGSQAGQFRRVLGRSVV